MSLKRKLNRNGGCQLVSYGILLYKKIVKDKAPNSFQFLLGLIPQRNWYTVFKGLPDDDEIFPEQTAIREFEEETGSSDLLKIDKFAPEATLYGRAGKKQLEIFLHEGSFFDPAQHFCLERVVKIDSVYMKGRPEIVGVRWLTLEEALAGVDGARIYKSQESILKEAQALLTKKYGNTISAEIEKKEKHQPAGTSARLDPAKR